jgi:hypothetical protein
MSKEVKMNLITAPDTLQNENIGVLLINPTEEDKATFNKVALELKSSINLYLYQDSDIEWLIDVVKMADYVFINIDNSRNIEWLHGWILNYSKTFYLTTQDHMPYNKINVNKVYDIAQMVEGENYFEERET